MASRSRGTRLVLFGPALLGHSVLAAPPASLDNNALTLEEMMEIHVYSASRQLGSIHPYPGVFCGLTAANIRRSHASGVSDARRRVPVAASHSEGALPLPLQNLSPVGRSLFDSHHSEQVLGKLAWKF